MKTDTPDHWESFLKVYGHAVYTAHLLEKDLATLLWFFEARKHNVIRRPTLHELDNLIDHLDRQPLGALLTNLCEHQIDHSVMELFQHAISNRNDLVHHFSMKFSAEIDDVNDFGKAVTQVEKLAAPIRLALAEAQSLVNYEIGRMRSDVERENGRTIAPFRPILGAKVDLDQ